MQKGQRVVRTNNSLTFSKISTINEQIKKTA